MSWTGTSAFKCQKLQCANPHDLVDKAGTVIGWVKDAKLKSDCGGSVTYTCKQGYQFCDKDGKKVDTAPTSKCNDGSKPEKGTQGFYDAIVGSCCPIQTNCKAPPAAQENAWKPVYMDTLDKTCDLSKWKRTLQDKAYSASKNIGQSEWVHGAKAVFECFDDFSAEKRPNFIKNVFDAEVEIGCAKKTGEICREKDTDAIFAAYDASADAAATKKAAVDSKFVNSRVIATCINGKWSMPSHACKCEAESANNAALRKAKLAKINDGMCFEKAMFAPKSAPAPPSSSRSVIASVFGVAAALALN